MTRVRNKTLPGNNDIVENFTVLPFDVRYAMQYKKGAVNYEEIACILDMSFWWAWFYLMMKLHQDNSYIQNQILDAVINHIDDKDALYDILKSIHKQHPTEQSIQGHKLGILSKYNFTGWDKAFWTIAHTCNKEGQTPIILLYAWLLALPSFLSYYQWDTIWLFNPKNPEKTIKFFKEQDKRQYIHMPLQGIDTNHIFIDDIYNTGASHAMANDQLKRLWFDFSLTIDSAVTMQALGGLHAFQDGKSEK